MKTYCGLTVWEHAFLILKYMVRSIFINIPMGLSAFVVVPVALLFCKQEDEHLSDMFRYYDDYLHGINGDAPWQRLVAPNGKNRTYWYRLRWLLRNRVTTFAYEVTGVEMGTGLTDFQWYGNPNVGNYGGQPGFMMAVATINGKKYGCYYFIHKWTKGISGRCLRVYVGYKMHREIAMAAGVSSKYPNTTVDIVELRHREPVLLQSVFVPNPVMGYDERGRQN